MSWLYSRALVAEYSVVLSSDGGQSAPSKSNPIPQAYLSSVRMTAFSRLSRFGMTFAPLTESRGAELLMLYLAGFPARISAPPDEAQASKANAPASGKNTPGLLAKYDRGSSSWKTVHSSLFEDLEPSSVIFPRWGMTRDGALFQRPTQALRISGKESGLWATPTVQDANGRDRHNQRDGSTILSLLGQARMWPTPRNTDADRGGRGDLIQAVRGNPNSHYKMWPTPRTTGLDGGSNSRNAAKARGMWPTPTVRDLKDGASIGNAPVNGLLGRAVGPTKTSGSLDPAFDEYLIGWPLGWTELKPLGTDKFRQWLDSHGKC